MDYDFKKKLTFKINNGSKIQKWCQNFDFDTKKWILKNISKIWQPWYKSGPNLCINQEL